MKVKKVQNRKSKPLSFDIDLGRGGKRPLHLKGKEVSRELTDAEFKSRTIQDMINKKGLLREITVVKAAPKPDVPAKAEAAKKPVEVKDKKAAEAAPADKPAVEKK